MPTREQTPGARPCCGKMDAYWRAANYLSVGQIYLLRQSAAEANRCRLEHIKPRLLGHWGTTPGLNFIYVHLNRIIKQHDLNMIYITGPGHGGPGWSPTPIWKAPIANSIPISRRTRRACSGCSGSSPFPAASPATPRRKRPARSMKAANSAIRLAHAYGAAFDNPDLIVACVVGDGEAETGPLATSWHSNKFLNPARDGAVLPILHLNGYKIASPTVLARIPRDELEALLARLRLHALFRRRRRTASDAPDSWPRRSTRCSPTFARSRTTRAATGIRAAAALADDRPAHAQGLDRPQSGRWPADRRHFSRRTRCRWRDLATKPEHLQNPRRMDAELPARGTVRPRRQLASRSWPRWRPRASAAWAPIRTPMAALLLRDLRLPDFRDYAVEGHRARRASMPKPRACRANSSAT